MMSISIAYDPNTFYVDGFYDSAHAPSTSLELTAEEYNIALAAMNSGKPFVQGSITILPPPAITPTATWPSVKAERDLLLMNCDYLMMPDYPILLATKTLWQTYRQELRDLPSTYNAPNGDPTTIVWPTPPTIIH